MAGYLQTVIACILIVGFVGTAWLYLRTRVEKSYAAQRDFGHVKNTLAQFSENLKTFSEEQDEIQAELQEIKACVLTFSQRMDSILTRLELNSGFFGRRENREP